jgi:hypothetical protein
MNNRRKFLLQSSLAATGLIIAKPFTAIAKHSSSLSGIGFNYNSITFLHTSSYREIVASQVIKAAANSSVVLLHAGNNTTETQQLNFDAAVDSLNENFEGTYSIIYKDSIKIGVIAANKGENDMIGRKKLSVGYLPFSIGV